MKYLTIAKRAQLAPTLALRRLTVVDNLGAAKSVFAKYKDSLSLSSGEDFFLRSTLLVGVVSQVEACMSDMAVELLVAFPGKLPGKQVDLERLAATGSIVETIRLAAVEHVNRLTFPKPFPETMTTLLKFFDPERSFEKSHLFEVNEIKCTRDLIVHNGGIVDGRYTQKAGSLSRGQEGKPIPLDDAYIEKSMDSVARLLADFYDLGPTRFSDRVPSRAFREMWEATVLQTNVPFDTAWEIRGGRVFRRELSWNWSSSEKMLFDFFLAIFDPQSPDIDTTVLRALRRWESPSLENHILRSWFDAPFWL